MYIESNPLPPLKRYKGESWKQHPLEPLGWTKKYEN